MEQLPAIEEIASFPKQIAPFAEKEYVDMARAARILGISVYSVCRLAEVEEREAARF